MDEQIGDKIAGSEPAISLHPQSLEEAIEWWDSGKSLFSVEMGGLGPGYEQALQIAAMELIREFKNHVIDWKNEEKVKQFNQEINDYHNGIITKLRLSGAQFGAAKSILCVFLRNGWEKGIEMAPEDRRIQISKNFP